MPEGGGSDWLKAGAAWWVRSAEAFERRAQTTPYPYATLVLIIMAILVFALAQWFLSSRSEPFAVPTVAPGTVDAEAQLRLNYLAQQVEDSRAAYDQMLQVVIGAISIVLVAVSILVGYSWVTNNRLSAEERADLRVQADHLRDLERQSVEEIENVTRRFIGLEIGQINQLNGRRQPEAALERIFTVAKDYQLTIATDEQCQDLLEAMLVGIRRHAEVDPPRPLTEARVDRITDALVAIPGTYVSLRRKIDREIREIEEAPQRVAEEGQEDLTVADREEEPR